MTTNILTDSNRNVLGNAAASVRATLAQTLERERANEAKHQRAQERERTRFENRLARERNLREARLKRAVRGARMLIALAQEPEIQELLAIWTRAHPNVSNVAVPFYRATRPSGDAWDFGDKHGSGTRDVEINLRAHEIVINQGAGAALDMDESKIQCSATDEQIATILRPLAGPYRSDVYLAHDSTQRSYEWHPPYIAFQVFVECSMRTRVQRLLKLAFDSSMFKLMSTV